MGVMQFKKYSGYEICEIPFALSFFSSIPVNLQSRNFKQIIMSPLRIPGLSSHATGGQPIPNSHGKSSPHLCHKVDDSSPHLCHKVDD